MNFLKPVLLVGIILVSCLVIVSRFLPEHAAAPRFEQLGTFASEAVAKHVQDGETVLLVTRGGNRPLLKAQVESFRAALLRQKSVVFEVAMLPEPPENEFIDYDASSDFDDVAFAHLIAPHGKPAMVVSFIGMPTLGKKTAARWKSGKPKFIVIGANRAEVEGPLKAGWIDAAVVFKTDATAEMPSSADEWVQRFYEVIESN